MNGTQVLVTGAGGFIGSHLVEALLHTGAKVRAFVRYTSRNDPGLLKLLSPEDYSKLEIIKEAFGLNCCHATRRCRGNGLAELVVLNIT